MRASLQTGNAELTRFLSNRARTQSGQVIDVCLIWCTLDHEADVEDLALAHPDLFPEESCQFWMLRVSGRP